jgi:hypothetical protein
MQNQISVQRICNEKLTELRYSEITQIYYIKQQEKKNLPCASLQMYITRIYLSVIMTLWVFKRLYM